MSWRVGGVREFLDSSFWFLVREWVTPLAGSEKARFAKRET